MKKSSYYILGIVIIIILVGGFFIMKGKLNTNLNSGNVVLETSMGKIVIEMDKNIPENEDKIVAYGEKLSATIFTFYLQMLGLPAKIFFAEEIPIITDDNFKDANIIYKISEKNIQKNLQEKINDSKKIPVIPGFTGITSGGKITTLGRGGTDTTACFVGSALRAHKIILWKDVGGVFSADPKIIPEAKKLSTISYEEAKKSGKITEINNKKINSLCRILGTPESQGAGVYLYNHIGKVSKNWNTRR